MRKKNKTSILVESVILSSFLILIFIPESFKDMEAQEVKGENSELRDTLRLRDTLIETQEVERESSGLIDTLTFKDTLSVPIMKDTLKTERKVTNLSFGVGEKLEFKVRWGPIKAGNATMEITEIIEFQGKKCFRVVSTAGSSKFFSAFFKVRDRVESFIDKEGLYSLHFEKHIREGKFKADKFVDFDQQNHLAIAGNDTIPVPPFVQDVLSALYYVRTQQLEVGKSLFVDNHTDKKNYPLEVKVLKKERVEVDAGTFDCLVVQPILQAAGVFEQKGTLTVWLTDDQKKMPVQMKSKVAIGSITTELKDYRLGRIGE
ncbi:MAG TPA: DUF3108 domain-containing protein [candidate division Zixibacteria bacterium]|jgi:hypothetical protein